MTELPEVSSSQANKETTINDINQALSPAAAFGIDWRESGELSLVVFGGVAPDGTEKSPQTVTLTGSQTNYVEMTTAGVVSSNTSAYTAGRVKLFRIVTNANGITSYTDDRSFSPGGLSVLGPTSSTDNAVARWDSTTGKVLQDSVVTISDLGAVAGATALTIASGTLTDPANALTITQTWNDAADTFVAASIDVTDTASAAGSLLWRARVGGVEKASITKAGLLTLAGALSLPAGAVGTPSAYFSTNNTSGLYQIAANEIGMSIVGVGTCSWIGGSTILGHTASIAIAGLGNPRLQMHGTNNNGCSIGMARWSNNSVSPFFFSAKSKGASIGTHAAVAADDDLLDFEALGSDGTIFVAAFKLLVEAAGTISSNVVPGRATLQTANAAGSLTTRMIWDQLGNVVCQSAAIATNATDGFLYVPTCAGTPTGTPTTFTGRAPIVVDTTNNKLYFYSGSWRDAGP